MGICARRYSGIMEHYFSIMQAPCQYICPKFPSSVKNRRFFLPFCPQWWLTKGARDYIMKRLRQCCPGFICESAGTGRQARLRCVCLWRVGSSPISRTKGKSFRTFPLLFVNFLLLLHIYVQQFPDLKVWIEGLSPYFISGGLK